MKFIEGADVVIHDAQYFEDEYSSHVGWGHATPAHAVDTATKGQAKKLVLFHYEPGHTDEQLAEVEKKYAGNALEVVVAKEGLVVEA
uniref:Beta-lactamase-like protein n=1 Tax=uncultured bacterium contig00201 TaxID=1181608 RepID=A0A806KLG6_9BACT|nr:beta-lactamase-like protein [uncultured bacterium contig00201]